VSKAPAAAFSLFAFADRRNPVLVELPTDTPNVRCEE
jgi:hypothetical protein